MVVDGAIHHGTEMAVEANYVDTHGQSEIGFGITKLLGFDRLPRIKRINKVKFYGPAAGNPDRWPGLTPALTRPINWSVLCLRICQASMVYVNVLMIQDILPDPDWDGLLTPEDERGLTPLFWSRVLTYGEVKLNMNTRLALIGPPSV